MPSEPAPIDVCQLLELGLDYFGRNRFEDAIECWIRVLQQEPGHPEAIDYLESAGVDTTDLFRDAERENTKADLCEAPASSLTKSSPLEDTMSSSQWTEDFLDSIRPPPATDDVECKDVDGLDCDEIGLLLSQRRYEEVLSLLYAARKRAPQDASLSKSIRHVRERLAREYAYRLVDLDRVPRPVPGRPWSALADADWSASDSAIAREARQLASLIDGISSFADIVAASPLGQLSTLRGLCTLLEREYVTVGSVNESATVGSISQVARAALDVEREKPPSHQVSRVIPINSEMAPASNSLLDKDEDYAGLFKCATEAYILRDFQRAIDLFGECCRRRPDDRRAQHNLETLMRRMRKT